MIAESRRAVANFVLSDAKGVVVRRGEAEAVVGDDALTVGEVVVALQDVDQLHAAGYSAEFDLWPGGRMVLSQIGRRFETFANELRRFRNQARVAGLLAHGITMPEVFPGALVTSAGLRPGEFQVYETHVTIVPVDGDPWQLPLGAMTAVRASDDPPGVILETGKGATMVGQLARQREAFQTAVVERREAQRRLLRELTGESVFSDGQGVPRPQVRGFDQLLTRFTSVGRTATSSALRKVATADPWLGFVQLLDPDGERLSSPNALPDNWAAFLLVPVGPLTVLEILAGPAAATYLFRGAVDAVNRDLQELHFRRAPLALTAAEAEITPENPHRLALRKLEPLKRLRAMTGARLIHNEGWEDALSRAVA